MQFLYVFLLMFLSIFGLAVLVRLAVGAILSGCVREYDIYVRSGEGIEEFVRFARGCPHIGRVVILAAGNEWDSVSEQLSGQYGNVYFTSEDFLKTER